MIFSCHITQLLAAERPSQLAGGYTGPYQSLEVVNPGFLTSARDLTRVLLQLFSDSVSRWHRWFAQLNRHTMYLGNDKEGIVNADTAGQSNNTYCSKSLVMVRVTILQLKKWCHS